MNINLFRSTFIVKKLSLLSLLLFITIQIYPFSSRGHDYLQDWAQLPGPNQLFRIDDSGIHNLKGGISVYGPWKAVPYLSDRLEEIAKSEFWDDDVVLILRDLEDPRSIPVLINSVFENDTAEAAKLLGRLKATEAIPMLIKLLYHKKYNIRAKSIAGLRLMGSKNAVPGIIKHGESILPKIDTVYTGHGAFISDLLACLGYLNDKRAIPFLRMVMEYNFPFEDDTQTIQKNAALALAMIGDKESYKKIAAIEKEYDACRIIRDPVALERARVLLTEKKFISEGMTSFDMSGPGIPFACRIFAEMGTKKDIPFLKERLQNYNLSTEAITGDHPPFGFGCYRVVQKTVPILISWALASIGDKEGMQNLDRYLDSDDIVIAAEAARAFVIMKKTDRYKKIAKVFRREVGRKSYDSKEFDNKYGIYDFSARARIDIAILLAEQQSKTALTLLVETLNDCNINVVVAIRRALKTFPKKNVIEELYKQYNFAGQQEVFQIASMLEILGNPGIQALYNIATTHHDTYKRSIAMRAIIRTEFKDWEKLITYATKQNDPHMRELIEWCNYRYEWSAPGFVESLYDSSFSFSDDDIPDGLIEAPAKFFQLLDSKKYKMAWEFITDDSRNDLVTYAGENYFDIDYYTIFQYFWNDEQKTHEVWDTYFSDFDTGKWADYTYSFHKYLADNKAEVTVKELNAEIIVIKEEGKWRLDILDSF